MPGGPFTLPRLILCEGGEDVAFLRRLTTTRPLPPFDIREVEEVGSIRGNTGFAAALQASVGVSGFPLLQHVVLIADSDDDETRTFNQICAQVDKANSHPDVNGAFMKPAAQFAASGGNPKMTIILMPGSGLPGALETLLWRAMTVLFPDQARCVEQSVTCCGIDAGPAKWPQSKIDKARVHSGLAIVNKKNPAISLRRLYSDLPQGNPTLIPVTHPAFNDLATALAAI